MSHLTFLRGLRFWCLEISWSGRTSRNIRLCRRGGAGWSRASIFRGWFQWRSWRVWSIAILKINIETMSVKHNIIHQYLNYTFLFNSTKYCLLTFNFWTIWIQIELQNNRFQEEKIAHRFSYHFDVLQNANENRIISFQPVSLQREYMKIDWQICMYNRFRKLSRMISSLAGFLGVTWSKTKSEFVVCSILIQSNQTKTVLPEPWPHL